MPSFDDTENHHARWPEARMHFVVETPATRSGYWFPLREMAVGDWLELDENEVEACRASVAHQNRGGDVRFRVRRDAAQDGIYICRRVE